MKQIKENKSLILKLCKKEKLKILNIRNINRKINRKKVLHNRLKSKKKGLRYEPAKNLEILNELATRLPKYFAENGRLKRSFVITKQGLKSWKLIK